MGLSLIFDSDSRMHNAIPQVTHTLGFDIPENTLFLQSGRINGWWLWDACIDGYFLVDVVMAFFTAFVDSRGIKQVEMGAIAKMYVFGHEGKTIPLGWFWLDFVSGFPLQVTRDFPGLDVAVAAVFTRSFAAISGSFS